MCSEFAVIKPFDSKTVSEKYCPVGSYSSPTVGNASIRILPLLT